MNRELIAEFVNFLKAAGRSNATIMAYSKDIEQLLESIDTHPAELGSDQLNDIIKRISAKYGFTPKTVSRKLNSYRIFYSFLKQKGLTKDNPAKQVEHPKYSAKVPRVLSPVEYLALREVTRQNIRLFTMIELMLQTGIRIGELARAQISHIEIGNPKGLLTITEYSTNPQRQVPLNAKITSHLEKYLQTLPQSYTPEHPLFATREGNPIIIRNIRSSIDRAMAKANVKDACVNDLRNTFIVGQLQAGLPIDLIAEIVGHRSRVTTNKYLELLEKPYKPSGETKLIEL